MMATPEQSVHPRLEDVEVRGKTVLVRVDFNVPVQNGNVADDTRIRLTLPTLEWLAERGARIVVMSHLGRPKGERRPEYSLKPVADHLKNLWHHPVHFVPDCVGDPVTEVRATLKAGEILLLENLRFHAGETKNDPEFARALASNGDVYINDAFGAAHRAHASVHAITQFFSERAFGRLMEREITYLSRLLSSPSRPYTAVLGGAKVSDKFPVIQNLLGRVDHLLIGGAMSYTFLKALGHDVGRSLVEDEHLASVQQLLDEANAKGTRIELPRDHRVVPDLDNNDPAAVSVIRTGDSFRNGYGVDIGPETERVFRDIITGSATVFWNGPMGIYERPIYAGGTRFIAQAVADCDGLTVVGGGDSLAALKEAGLLECVTHASTGGGASLQFLAGRKLPGIVAMLGEDSE